jgi:hypothetical protein
MVGHSVVGDLMVFCFTFEFVIYCLEMLIRN